MIIYLILIEFASLTFLKKYGIILYINLSPTAEPIDKRKKTPAYAAGPIFALIKFYKNQEAIPNFWQ